MTPRSLRTLRISAIFFVVAALSLAGYFGAFDEVSDPKSLARGLVAMGAWGDAAFILAYALFNPCVGLPASFRPLSA